MPQYIFSLNTTAAQGTSSLSVDSESIDKVTGNVVNTSNILKPGVLVSTLAGDIIPDSTTIVSVTIANNSLKIGLSDNLQKNLTSGEDVFFNIFINKLQQGKIGLDKKSIPSISQYQQLADIVTGDTLIDENNNPLVSLTKVPLRALASSDKSTSAVLGSNIVKVREVFPETSQVSTSLLGVPKSETQLGLFSDVSVLGLDDEIWEYRTTERTGSLFEWERRKTLNNDNHYPSEFIEAADQQALQITCFPPPYKYPWAPPNYQYLNPEFLKFKEFVKLGNNLYDYFSGKDELYGPGFADNFLDKSKVKIGPIDFRDINGNLLVPNKQLTDQIVIQGISRDQGFLLIDIWTNTFIDINANALINKVTGLPFTTKQLKDLTGQYANDFDPFASSQPGYTHGEENPYQNEIVLQSKRTFRYQPGRISGFTFGVKASSDSGSESNIVEWGTYNSTDQYLFQIRGASINIVRRSTIPLPIEVLETYGLDSNDQTSSTFIDTTTGVQRVLYEVVIPRSLWNVDSLDGNGPSGYLLTSKQVTMYKIEFSWYGAIGANFYAYIPVGSGECRWVLLNKLIIENKMGKVCLEDPFFKFRYYLKIQDPKNLKTPQFLYKYGASYYIDGGDEGSNMQASITGSLKTPNDVNRSVLLGIHPKPYLQNEQGYKKYNKKAIIPTSLTVTSSNDLAKVDIATCKACPGFGYTYDQGLLAKDTISNRVTFYYDNLATVPVIKTKYEYDIIAIDYSTSSVSVTAENLPYKFRQGDIFTFLNVSSNSLYNAINDIVYRIDNVTEVNNTLTFQVSSSTGDFPDFSAQLPTGSDLEMRLFSQLFTVDNHLSKIIAQGVHGIYADMQPITATAPIAEIYGKKYFNTCNLYKVVSRYNKQKITNNNKTSLFRSSSEFNWTTQESLNPTISGGLGLFFVDDVQLKLINHDFFTDKEEGITYYPRQAVISNRNKHIAASNHTIMGANADIQFLLPHAVYYDSTHIAEFAIGVTPKRPVEIDGEVKFDYNGEYKDLEERDFLNIEYMLDAVWMPRNFEEREVIHKYSERLIIDREIPALDYNDGGGMCGKISITLPDPLRIKNCNFKTGTELLNEYNVTGLPADNIYILTQDNALENLELELVGGQVGINGSATEVRFASDVVSFNFGPEKYFYMGVTGSTADVNFTLGFSYVRLTFPTGDGILYKREEYMGPNYRDKVFDFNPYPLYLVIKMNDRAKINSITIKENFGNNQLVTSPYWLVNSGVTIDTVNGKAKDNSQLNDYFPENFISNNRLEASEYDTQGNRRLRESATINKASYYIGEGETKKINLDGVFGLSKTLITQDIYGLDAVFVTGKNETKPNNEMQVTLNISEQ